MLSSMAIQLSCNLGHYVWDVNVRSALQALVPLDSKENHCQEVA